MLSRVYHSIGWPKKFAGRHRLVTRRSVLIASSSSHHFLAPSQCLLRASHFTWTPSLAPASTPSLHRPLLHAHSRCHTAPRNAPLKPSPTITTNTPTTTINSQTLFELARSTYTVNQFTEPKVSWNDCISQARTVAQYDMDLYQRMLSDAMLSKFLDYRKLEENKTFQAFVSHYFRTYNYQITGLITILLTKLFLYSKHLWLSTESSGRPGSAPGDDHKLQSDLTKLAECYDMISYGFYFHDTIEASATGVFEGPGPSFDQRSLRNLLLLLGDYFLVKSSYDVASFSRIDLYKIYVQTVSKCSEGEALSLAMTGGQEELTRRTSETYCDNAEVAADIYLNNDHAESCAVVLPTRLQETVDPPSLSKLINYCYLTSGHLVASSLQSAFYLANCSDRAQSYAFEFGKNIGMAVKISNQLSAQFVAKLTSDSPTSRAPLPINHLNLSYFAKFPTVGVEVMQYLLGEYTNRAIQLLSSLCEVQPDGERGPPFSNGRLSDRSAVLMETLLRLLQEIHTFNGPNMAIHGAQRD